MDTQKSPAKHTLGHKDPRESLLPGLGGLGHTFFVIEPCDRPDNIYGGWRNCSESSSLKDALADMQAGRQIWQKTDRKKYKNVTP